MRHPPAKISRGRKIRAANSKKSTLPVHSLGRKGISDDLCMKESESHVHRRRVVFLLVAVVVSLGLVLHFLRTTGRRETAQVIEASKRPPGAQATSSESGDDRGAPSLANLEWLDQTYRQYYLEVLDDSNSPEFSPYQMQLTELLADSKTLHEYAQERYRISLATNRLEAFAYALADTDTEAALGQIAAVLKDISKNPPDADMATDTVRWQDKLEAGRDKSDRVLAAYSVDSAAILRYAEDPKVLTNLMREGYLKLQSSRSRLAHGDTLGAWISVVHADLLLGSESSRLLTYETDVFGKKATGVQ
jgi:hypothetical protein